MHNVQHILRLFILALIVVSCTNDARNNFTLKGRIKGFKKGVVYLEKDGDSSAITLDSMVINGQPEFTLTTTLEEPTLLYLKLFKNDNDTHYIPFFGDEGITEMKSTLKNLIFNAEITGSKQQDLLNQYTRVMSDFNNQNLDLIEAKILAQKDKDAHAIDSLNKRSETLYKRKYSYTIQFALNHNDNIIAPYLALYEIPSANPIYIDSVYNGLTDNIKASMYGKKLHRRIKNNDTKN